MEVGKVAGNVDGKEAGKAVGKRASETADKSVDRKAGREPLPARYRKANEDGRHAAWSLLTLATAATHRVRGLLCTNPCDEALLLMPCGDIHTVGMRHAIDVAFVDRTGCVLEAHRSVGPLRRLHNKRAVAVVERFATCKPWFEVGDRIGLSCMRRAESPAEHETCHHKMAERRR